MHNVRHLKKLKTDSKILCPFYNSVISSVLIYAISLVGMMPAITKTLQELIAKFHDKVCKITDVSVHESIEQPSNVYITKCKSFMTKIVNDHDHSTHKYITVLPHGNLRAVKKLSDSVQHFSSSNQLYNVK